ncbi:MAG: hypothetical protein GY933_12585, partial [Hyphomicrobiales bacterium]|nr:hypothetical protein [Hyphomicrobiales bacterium]
ALKAIEDYQNEFRFHFPNEHRPAGRPVKTTPLTFSLEDCILIADIIVETAADIARE